jgi:hypothetical protein
MFFPYFVLGMCHEQVYYCECSWCHTLKAPKIIPNFSPILKSFKYYYYENYQYFLFFIFILNIVYQNFKAFFVMFKYF